MNTLTESAPDSAASAMNATAKLVVAAERDRAHTEDGDRDQQRAPDASGHRPDREEQRDAPGADADRGAEKSKSDRTDSEPRLRDRGKRARRPRRTGPRRDRARSRRAGSVANGRSARLLLPRACPAPGESARPFVGAAVTAMIAMPATSNSALPVA